MSQTAIVAHDQLQFNTRHTFPQSYFGSRRIDPKPSALAQCQLETGNERYYRCGDNKQKSARARAHRNTKQVV
ncbi:hypothetical protein EVAR_96085_1 [Eumeta japonica]|uniref:Uncharacterized protein n=1 Tax=Eumeta variegata TaxID=151549 RepID=A0A4C1VE09_EUMVA|nr:hypothetical protein EVAR_96085_1 [Eumeta japonica]